MLRLVESPQEKTRVHARWLQLLGAAWRGRETRTIVWRPSSRRAAILHNEHFWLTSVPPGGHPGTPRYWNPLGVYAPSGALQIAVRSEEHTSELQSHLNLVC